MEHIFCEEPIDYMITVKTESVECVKRAALKRRLTTNKLAIRAGVGRNIVDSLYYKHRIKRSHLQAICDVVFEDDYEIKILWKEKF